MSDDQKPNRPAGLSEVTRRALIGAAALGAGAVLVPGAGCGILAAEPKRGGQLKLGIDGASSQDSLDPATYTATYMQMVGYTYGNCLVELDETNQLVPELAESWEPSDDAKTWVFKLRRGVLFHNGKEMAAEDVVASLNYHRGENSKSGARAYLSVFSEIKVSDKHEVTLTLPAGNADVPYILSDYHLLIMPAGAAPDSALGTGAFVKEAFEPGVRYLGKRNPNYWKAGRGHADSVEQLAINDQTARTSALQTGSVHFVNRLDPKTVGLLKRVAGVQVVDVPSAGHYAFVARCDTAPFDNVDLRLALKHGIDREDMVKRLLRGYGKIGNDHPIASFDPFHASDIPQRTYDPDKAKFHFQKSGVEGPVRLSIADAAFTGAVDAATIYGQHLAKCGITLEVQRTPNDGYWNDVWMKAPFCGTYWGGRPTADLMLSVAYASDAAWNETFWRRPDFDKLLAAARAELDTPKRKQMYHDLQLMIRDDGGAVIPMFNNYIFGQRDEVAGLVQAPVLTGLRCAEQLYFV
jgi:peptide/nickel transport system substrate-binding protein